MDEIIDLLPKDTRAEVLEEVVDNASLRGSLADDQLEKVHRVKDVEIAALNSMTGKLHELDGAKDGEATVAVLKVRGLTYPLDQIVVKARDATGEFYRKELLKKGKRIEQRGMTAVVAKVTKRLNARGLDDVERLLLALPHVYEYLLIDAVTDQKVPRDDDEALLDAVLRAVAVKPRRYLLNEIAGRVLDVENIELQKEELTALRDLAFERGISLRAGDVRADVQKLLTDSQSLGALRDHVDRYALKGEIDRAKFTESVKREMARYLYTRGIRIRPKDAMAVERGDYDEHFVLAYHHATRVAEGADDPIDVARTKGGVADWDFTIRRISQSDRPVIRAQSIRAAGALYTTFVEGEQMRVFDIADSLLTEWHRGELDIPDGETASLLNRYEILMRDRPTEEERQMHYRRVFNIGDAEILSGTVVNEAFPALWDNLMYEATRYIDKTERYYTEEKVISRTALYQALQDLQYNLSEYMTGSAPKKTTEMYRHLEEALDIIGSEDVLSHMGGRRKSILAVIERMGRASLGVSIPATSLVTVAERGNDIFQFIGEFAPENVEDDQFQRFLDACKACIVSQAALEPREEEEAYAGDRGSNGYENGDGSTYQGARRNNGYAAIGRNGYHRNGAGSTNGYGSRRPAGVGASSGSGGFDDWDS